MKDNLKFVVKDSGGQVPAAASITESSITESTGAGIYTATLKGNPPGEYTVVPEYNGATMGSLKAIVTLVATMPVEQYSSITMDSTSYISGTDVTVKVMLKDTMDNAVSGQAALLTAGAVSVPNACLKTGSSWRDDGDGTYTATYTATTAGVGLKARLKLSGGGVSNLCHYGGNRGSGGHKHTGQFIQNYGDLRRWCIPVYRLHRSNVHSRAKE